MGAFAILGAVELTAACCDVPQAESTNAAAASAITAARRPKRSPAILSCPPCYFRPSSLPHAVPQLPQHEGIGKGILRQSPATLKFTNGRPRLWPQTTIYAARIIAQLD